MLNSKVCESATISQRSINDDDKDRDEKRDRFDRALILCEKGSNFDQLQMFAVELFT